MLARRESVLDVTPQAVGKTAMARDQAYREAEQKIEAARQSGAKGLGLRGYPRSSGELTDEIVYR